MDASGSGTSPRPVAGARSPYALRRRRAWITGSLATACLLAVTGLVLALNPGNIIGEGRSAPAGGGTGASGSKIILDAYPLYWCRGYSSLPRDNPKEQVLRDEFAWGRFKAVKVGDGRGDIDWAANPHRRVSWQMWLNSLRWLGQAIDPGDPAALDHSVAIARDWVRDHPYSWKSDPVALEPTMHRTNTLLCLRQALAVQAGGTLPPGQSWIDDALRDHGRFLTENYSGRGNHGTDESIALLGVGCNLHLDEFTQTAATRLESGLIASIDPEGSTDEQSAGYAFFNRALWATAEERVSLCAPSSPVAPLIRERLRLLETWLAHATTSLGPLQQLGNTQWVRDPALGGTPQEYPATLGERGTPPPERARTYAAGYVFGRASWGSAERPYREEPVYALRFGPRRALHGHDDHTAITWQARGHQILRDTGYGEYTRDSWEEFAKSARAHNQLVVEGQTATGTTRLTRSDITGDAATGIADSYRLTDSPAPGVTRTRDVIVLSDPDLVVVYDRARARSRRTFTQYWHLPAGQKVAMDRDRTTVTADAGDTRTTVLRLPHGDERRPAGSGAVVQGAVNPVNGWYWGTIFERVAAPTVSFTIRGRSASMVTAIAAGPSGSEVRASMSKQGSSRIYTFDVGGKQARVELAASGALTRLR